MKKAVFKKIVQAKSNANYHVIGRGNILNSRAERFKKYRGEWANNPRQFKVAGFPLHLDIETTNYCNLKCPYCAATYNRWGNNNKGKMSLEIFKRIIDEGADNGLYSIKFSLRGEPLIHNKLPGMIKYAKSKKIIDMYFNTNGVLLTAEKSRQLVDAKLNRISISCDGWDKESFEHNRTGAKFERVFDNIANLRKIRDKAGARHPQIRIQTVMLPQIKQHWQEFIKLWQPLADEVGYLDARDEGPGVDHKGLKADWACPFLWQRMVILWDGTILPCLLHGVRDSSAMEMGNILDTTIKKQWLSARLKTYRNLHKNGKSHKITACDACSYRAAEIKKNK